MQYRNFISRSSRSESGFTLVELIVAMTIVSMTVMLAVGGYLKASDTARNTSNRDYLAAAYKPISNCKSENDGLYSSYAFLVGEYCLHSKVVANNIRLCTTLASDQNPDNRCPRTDSGSCWNTQAAKTDGMSAAQISAAKAKAQSISPSPPYETSGRTFNVGLCTFNTVNSAGASTLEDHAESMFLRLSTERNKKVYYFVEYPSGVFTSCFAPADGFTGKPTAALICRKT